MFREGTAISEVRRPVPDADGQWRCEEGYKQCGSSDNRSFKNTCIRTEDECPVNNITVNDRTVIPPPEGENWVVLDLADNMYLAFTYDADALPIVEFMVSEGLPCVDPKEHNLKAGRY